MIQKSDRFKKTYRIGVRFDGQTLTLLDGAPLFPSLRKGCVAELIVSPESVTNQLLEGRLAAETTVKLVDAESYLMVGVSPNMLDTFREGLVDAVDVPIVSQYVFVPIRLEWPLLLRVRGDQEARLSECSCTIPSLNATAKSLNHAFTLISEAYETKRLSHSGNVFERIYAEMSPGWWRSLDNHRTQALSSMGKQSDGRTGELFAE